MTSTHATVDEHKKDHWNCPSLQPRYHSCTQHTLEIWLFRVFWEMTITYELSDFHGTWQSGQCSGLYSCRHSSNPAISHWWSY